MATDFDYIQGEILDIKDRLNRLEEKSEKLHRGHGPSRRPVCPVCGADNCEKAKG